jgi:hypothetical protein
MRKKTFWVALTVMCAMTVSMNGQNETPQQKYERLAKAADANPTDWEKQFEAGRMLINKENGLFDQVGAGKYYDRIYHIATDVNRAVPDSVFMEAAMTLMFNAMNHQDTENTLFYGDEMKRYARVTNNKESLAPMMANTMGVMMMMAAERPAGAVDKLNELRKDLEKHQFAGVENTDVTLAMVYEQMFVDYRKFADDKLMEVTVDGKPYVILAMGIWNVEMPFMGWAQDVEGAKPILMDEEGNVHDDIHGQILFNFHWSEKDKAVVKSEDTNTRLITVTPERRQQMVAAYKEYLKKQK